MNSDLAPHIEFLPSLRQWGFTICLLFVAPPALMAAEPALNGPLPIPVLQLGHSAEVTSLAFSPDGKSILSAGFDDTAILWDVPTGKPRLVLRGHTQWITAVTYSPDSKTVATGGFDGVSFWDARTGDREGTLEPYPGVVRAMQFAPDGKTLAVGSDGQSPVLWDAATHHRIKELGTDVAGIQLPAQSGAGINSLVFTPNGRAIATGHADGLVRIWNVDTGEIKATLHGHGATVKGLAFSPDASLLATTCEDGSARIWDTATRLTRFTLDPSERAVRAAAFSPDGLTLATAGVDASPRLWDVKTGKLQGVCEWWEKEPIAAIAFSPDGLSLAAGGGATADPGVVRLWDVRRRSIKWQMKGRTNVVTCAAFSPDGKVVVTGGGTGARLWDAATWKLRRSLSGGDGWTHAVAFSPDSKTVAFGGWGGTIQTFDVETGKPLGAFRPLYGLGGIAFSPDGTLIGGCAGSAIKIWSVAGGDPIITIKAPTDISQMIAISADNKVVAIGSTAYHKVWLFDIPTGAPKGTLDHGNSILSIALSPDSKLVASGAWDGLVKLWNIDTGQVQAQFPVGDGVSLIAISKDGRSLAASGMGGQLRVWEINKPAATPTIGVPPGTDYPPDILRPIKLASGSLILESPSTGKPIAMLTPLPRATSAASTVVENTAETRNASWFVSTREGFFDCSDSALQLLRWNLGGVLYDADHFAPQLHQPDLVEKALRGL